MKKILLLLLLLIVFISCKCSSATTSKSGERETKKLITTLIETATENLGMPYKEAGTTKDGFDCSGLVFTTFASENIKLPRSSFEQSKIGKIVNPDNAKKGDLIFFKTNNGKQINHVGLIIEINPTEIKFIHSSTSKGVIISSTKEIYYKNSYTQINRIIE
ncbi:C40 family peptidase [Flavobacterium sp.]|uniref:C40 family peptidase n=1 Tax=Flavobacterium sp. TaxID=239 RepID=UPI00326621FD